MAIEVEKSSLSINKIIANKTEIATIEGDCIVPDIKPDIIDIIGTSGIVSIYKKEITEGKMRIDGAVSTYVMYNGNDGENTSARSLNHVLDFSQIIKLPEAKEGMQDIGNVSLESVVCTVINERKVRIKANLVINLNISCNTTEEYISNIHTKKLQKIDSKINVNTVLGVGNTKTSINEIVKIDNADTLAEILKVNTAITNTDTKVSYNKILVKSDVVMSMLYSTEDGRYNVVKSTFPIMGFVEMKDVTDDNIIQTNVEIKNTIINPKGSQENIISVDMEVGIDTVVYGNKEIEVVKDMYSPSVNLAFNQREIETLQNINICRNTMSFIHKEYMDTGDEKIYDINARVNISEVKAEKNGIVIKGNLQFNCIHSKNRMIGLEIKKLEVPFEHKVMCDNVNTNSNVEAMASIDNENYNIMPGGEIDIKLDVSFTIVSYNIINIEIIDNVDETEAEVMNPYNVVIYYTREGDTLWKVAKEFRSTVDQIINDNAIKNEVLQPGTQLFISRY